MALVYLINKPHVFQRITKWLLLFSEYKFIVVYKPNRTHVVANALSKLLDCVEPLGIPDQIVDDASLFFIQPIWMQEVNMSNA
jgi:hypothetical protein